MSRHYRLHLHQPRGVFTRSLRENPSIRANAHPRRGFGMGIRDNIRTQPVKACPGIVKEMGSVGQENCNFIGKARIYCGNVVSCKIRR